MALVGGPGDPAAPQGAGPPPSGLVFTDFGADSGGGPGGAGAGVGNELGAALAGLSFHPAPSPGQAASESMPIAIPGGHAGLRRPGGLGGPGEFGAERGERGAGRREEKKTKKQDRRRFSWRCYSPAPWCLRRPARPPG